MSNLLLCFCLRTESLFPEMACTSQKLSNIGLFEIFYDISIQKDKIMHDLVQILDTKSKSKRHLQAKLKVPLA